MSSRLSSASGRHHLDELGGDEPGRGADPHAPARPAEQGLDRRGQPGGGRLVAQVDEIGRLGGALALQHQAQALILGLDRHPFDARAAQQLFALRAVDTGAGYVGEARDGLGGAHPLQQPLPLEGGQGRGKGQRAAARHEQDGEREQARREAARPEEAGPLGPGKLLRRGGGVRHDTLRTSPARPLRQRGPGPRRRFRPPLASGRPRRRLRRQSRPRAGAGRGRA